MITYSSFSSIRFSPFTRATFSTITNHVRFSTINPLAPSPPRKYHQPTRVFGFLLQPLDSWPSLNDFLPANIGIFSEFFDIFIVIGWISLKC